MTIFTAIRHDETGAAMAEYAMLLAIIAVAVIGAHQMLRDPEMYRLFNKTASTLGSTTISNGAALNDHSVLARTLRFRRSSDRRKTRSIARTSSRSQLRSFSWSCSG